MVVGHLKGEVKEGRFLGRRGEKEWQRGKIGGRREVGLSLGGRSHTRRGRVFHGLGLFGGVRRRLRPGGWRVQW